MRQSDWAIVASVVILVAAAAFSVWSGEAWRWVWANNLLP